MRGYKTKRDREGGKHMQTSAGMLPGRVQDEHRLRNAAARDASAVLDTGLEPSELVHVVGVQIQIQSPP
jgi:hypothetical protein